ncbi:hypothetical protein HUG10_17210 [Halorarum halophilum]|uniref:Halobacterial output domain-containing protein n=1 Tax=Halorarum halophilum TaxID=2743090 RepID=A0A7D5KP71_9EURY|nr:HalOD1 output domain-containing protein [Halobaculum halophilum]QLG29162.1 hypothetical protein HUG10_17210 [Halobaculum halophilum]
MSQGIPLSAEVVERVAEREGVRPTHLGEPLNDYIDPDALDALFDDAGDSGTSREGSVEFTYCGYKVVARSSGAVAVEELPEAGEASRNHSTIE